MVATLLTLAFCLPLSAPAAGASTEEVVVVSTTAEMKAPPSDATTQDDGSSGDVFNLVVGTGVVLFVVGGLGAALVGLTGALLQFAVVQNASLGSSVRQPSSISVPLLYIASGVLVAVAVAGAEVAVFGWLNE